MVRVLSVSMYCGGSGQRTDLTCCCLQRKEVYRQLRGIYPSLACRQFMDSLQQLEKECGYGEERIPQLREVSAFLKGDTHSTRAVGKERDLTPVF